MRKTCQIDIHLHASTAGTQLQHTVNTQIMHMGHSILN